MKNEKMKFENDLYIYIYYINNATLSYYLNEKINDLFKNNTTHQFINLFAFFSHSLKTNFVINIANLLDRNNTNCKNLRKFKDFIANNYAIIWNKEKKLKIQEISDEVENFFSIYDLEIKEIQRERDKFIGHWDTFNLKNHSIFYENRILTLEKIEKILKDIFEILKKYYIEYYTDTKNNSFYNKLNEFYYGIDNGKIKINFSLTNMVENLLLYANVGCKLEKEDFDNFNKLLNN